LSRARLGVDLPATFNLVAALIKYLSLAPLVPAAVAVGYGESPAPFLLATAIGFSGAWFVERISSGKRRVGMREGFLVVTLTWLFAAVIGALPYWLTADSQFSNPLNCYFEAMSGFTTTGATIVTDVEGLPHGLAIWRQLTQWLGGMGIIVLALAVLPRLRVGGRQLLESELPGPEIEEMTLRIRDTARQLWLLYIALTAVMVVVLTVIAWTGLDSAMSFYQAVAHALTTMPTGGFSTEARSLEAFGAASQWAIAFFMAVAGINFALMYRAFFRRQPGVFLRDEEFRLYVALLLLGSLVVVVELWSENVLRGEAAIRTASSTRSRR
jgi:trk system potassium uptake protein TrkH